MNEKGWEYFSLQQQDVQHGAKCSNWVCLTGSPADQTTCQCNNGSLTTVIQGQFTQKREWVTVWACAVCVRLSWSNLDFSGVYGCVSLRFRQPPVEDSDELEGVHEVVMTVREHMSIKPGFPRTGARQGWNGFVSRAGRGHAGGLDREGNTNASWQRGLFPSNTQAHILNIQTQERTINTRSCCLPPHCSRSLSNRHTETSSRAALRRRDAIKWSRGTWLLCNKSLRSVTLRERCSTFKSILMRSTTEMRELHLNCGRLRN